jgi:hypothetical protein
LIAAEAQRRVARIELDDISQTPRARASGSWTQMQNVQSLNPSKYPIPAATTKAASPRKSDPNWKPQPCGLTREELRKIVEEILG